LILFILFGGFFELIFSAGARFGLRQVVFPVALILLGLYLIYNHMRSSGVGTSENEISSTNDLEEKL